MTLRTWILPVLTLTLAVPTAVRGHHTDEPLRVSEAWVRETPPGRTISAAYFTIENTDHESDFLLAAKCDVAGLVELHTMKVEGDRMVMEKVEKIELRPQEKTTLAPGGLHVMLFDLKRPLKAGETVELKLSFQFAGEVGVTAVVKAPPPSRP